MTKVVGMDGKTIDHDTPQIRSKNARIALAALLARIDAGELQLDSWILLFDKQNPNNENTALGSLDSGLSVAQVIYLMESCKFDLMLLARDMVPR